ncbi:MAG TPA: hypothetical protein DEB17_09135 [Chlorobaculum sp.]|uniref:Uncharacterized protein n=1 Tax=Chlorobaculum tepidum (strain ATCC 49652 / DSM 12025 / NBRC 103806 / TLS) TaxID=194439 RepID=Q8KB72_CHLTE|nr:hypothetical protein CT1917 [Chlorobaculum tepidum TLS]HBU24130.1 hypothetical protein [Chlorobaculum sp.]
MLLRFFRQSTPLQKPGIARFFAFLGGDEKGNPVASFPDLFARRNRFFTFNECVG